MRTTSKAHRKTNLDTKQKRAQAKVLILVEKNLVQHFFEHLLRTTETSRSPELLALLHAWSLSAAPTVRSLAPCQAKTPAPCTDQQNDQRKTKKKA